MLFDSVVTPLIQGALQPNIPELYNLFNPVFQQGFGALDKDLQQKMSKWEEELAGTDLSEGRRAKLQKKLDDAKEKQEGRMDKSYAQQQLNAYSDWLPKFGDMALKLNEQMLPGLIDQQGKYGQQLGQAYQDAQKSMSPEFFDLRTALANDLQKGIGMGLTPEQSNYFSSQLAQQQAGRGLFDSPLSSVNSARALTELDLTQRQRNIGNTQSFLNTYQMPFVPQVLGIQGMTGQGLSGNLFTPMSQQDLFNQSVGLRGMKYAKQMAQANALGSGIVESGNNLVSALMGGMGGGGGMLGGMMGGIGGGMGGGGMGGITNLLGGMMGGGGF